MKNWKLESCHSIGYGWDVDAPEQVTEAEIAGLCTALVSYSDTPQQSDYDEMLNDMTKEEFIKWGLNQDNITLYRQVNICTDIVHREAFTQSLEENK